MKKLLVICGPTASGKTNVALKLARLFKGEILSADSRQVYKGMDIGTGKDTSGTKFVPHEMKEIKKTDQLRKLTFGYYRVKATKIWGLDIVSPEYAFNIADYVIYAREVLGLIWSQGKLPLLVGGSGLYLNAVTNTPETIDVPLIPELRQELSNLSLDNLQKKLRGLNPLRWQRMNKSDRANPRRLTRAIEIALSKQKGHKRKIETNIDILKIGLTPIRETLYQQIDRRVEERLKNGMEKEVRQLLSSGLVQSVQARSATGYREFLGVLKTVDRSLSNEELEDIVQRWKFAEHAYARRQLTWFKKDKDIHWFDPAEPNYYQKVVETVRDWYN